MDTTNLSKLREGWRPPEGLNRSWPRPVALTGRGILVCVLMAVFLVGDLIGAAFLYGTARREHAVALRMRAEGRETQGEVTRLWREGDESNTHRVGYQFTVDGRDRTDRATIGGSYWGRLHTGDRIAIRYLPSDPADNFPSSSPPAPMPNWPPLVLVVTAIPCAGFVFLKLRKERRLLEGGRPAPALVTRLRKWHAHQGGTQYTVHYEFALPDGGVCKGKAGGQSKPMPEGSVVCILYDPDDPRRSAPYPMCLVKLAVD